MKCPCCGGEIAELPMPELLSLALTPTEERMVRAFIDRHPRGVRMDQFISDVYFIHDEPEGGVAVVRTIMTRLRKKLETVNWTIPRGAGGRGNNVLYRLEPLT